MTVRVSGLDLSMTGTGVARTQNDGSVYTTVIRPKDAGDRRLTVIRKSVLEHVLGADIVLIEGFLNKSMSAGITGMVHGAVRSALIEAAIPYATMAPASLKRYATGKGGASKTDMAVAAFKRGGVEFADDNQCDAWWLYVAARDYMGDPMFPLPSVNREGLDKIKIEYGTVQRYPDDADALLEELSAPRPRSLYCELPDCYCDGMRHP